MRHRLQSDRPTEQLKRVTEAERFEDLASHKNTQTAALEGKLTVQILRAVDEEVVLPPHVDGGQVFLNGEEIIVLQQRRKVRDNGICPVTTNFERF